MPKAPAHFHKPVEGQDGRCHADGRKHQSQALQRVFLAFRQVEPILSSRRRRAQRSWFPREVCDGGNEEGERRHGGKFVEGDTMAGRQSAGEVSCGGCYGIDSFLLRKTNMVVPAVGTRCWLHRSSCSLVYPFRENSRPFRCSGGSFGEA